MEVGGADTLAQSVKAIGYGGQISLVGILAGAEGGIDFMTMFRTHATFTGHCRRQPSRPGEDLGRVLVQHDIRPVIDSVFAFDDAKAGLSHFAGRQLFGKVVIRH